VWIASAADRVDSAGESLGEPVKRLHPIASSAASRGARPRGTPRPCVVAHARERSRPGAGASRPILHVTLGELIEAVAAEAGGLCEQAVVVEHLLRTRAVAPGRPPGGLGT
jgi:hypothetical protein